MRINDEGLSSEEATEVSDREGGNCNSNTTTEMGTEGSSGSAMDVDGADDSEIKSPELTAKPAGTNGVKASPQSSNGANKAAFKCR